MTDGPVSPNRLAFHHLKRVWHLPAPGCSPRRICLQWQCKVAPLSNRLSLEDALFSRKERNNPCFGGSWILKYSFPDLLCPSFVEHNVTNCPAVAERSMERVKTQLDFKHLLTWWSHPDSSLFPWWSILAHLETQRWSPAKQERTAEQEQAKMDGGIDCYKWMWNFKKKQKHGGYWSKVWNWCNKCVSFREQLRVKQSFLCTERCIMDGFHHHWLWPRGGKRAVGGQQTNTNRPKHPRRAHTRLLKF